MKVSTLACILGAWAGSGRPHHILDIGAGTGLLSLMMAQRFEKSLIDAVEIDPVAAAQAKDNVERSKWDGRTSVYCEDIRNFQSRKDFKYDLIVSNPPFFNNQTPSLDEKKNLARHGYALTLKQLAAKVSSLLCSSGHFYVLLPEEESDDMQSNLKNHHLYPFCRLSVYNRPGSSVKAVITGYSSGRLHVDESEVMLWDVNGNYDKAYVGLMREFYLYF
jgi:tRNA1Val (adenine37-N6)-methyltransferase